jgi:hypothetical protein
VLLLQCIAKTKQSKLVNRAERNPEGLGIKARKVASWKTSQVYFSHTHQYFTCGTRGRACMTYGGYSKNDSGSLFLVSSENREG